VVVRKGAASHSHALSLGNLTLAGTAAQRVFRG